MDHTRISARYDHAIPQEGDKCAAGFAPVAGEARLRMPLAIKLLPTYGPVESYVLNVVKSTASRGGSWGTRYFLLDRVS